MLTCQSRENLSEAPGDPAADLAARAKGGDRAAFEQLADFYWEEVFRMLYFRVANAADAEDLCQEVFLKAYTRLASLRKPESVRAWLYGIALNQARDFQRKQRLRAYFRTASLEDERASAAQAASGPSALEAAASKDFWRQVADFCQSLPRSQREVFTLRYLDGLTIPEIAHARRSSESSVKTHLYRAVQRFKRSPGLLRELREAL
ncbi:hypothetical protein AAU61_01750 [Desulfocarbo indianensis]|nr:hypothetical protein AAU61_01750 [Desulfocarbo indianensis]